MKDYIKNNYDVAKSREVSGFQAFYKSENIYMLWPNPKQTKWNSVYVKNIDEQTILEVKELAKDFHLNLISMNEIVDEKILKYLILDEISNILNLKTKTQIAYKSNLKIKEVENINELKLWVDFASNLYGCDADFVFNAFKNDLEIKCAKYFLGYKNDKIIAVSQIITNKETAGVYWVGVDEKYRKKGYGFDITAFAINSAINNNIHNFTLSATEMGEKIYKSMGFTNSGKLYEFLLV